MPSLYNEYEMLNDDGANLCKALQSFTVQFIAAYAERYPLREIDSVICNDIHVTICEMLLQKSIDLSRAKRNA